MHVLYLMSGTVSNNIVLVVHLFRTSVVHVLMVASGMLKMIILGYDDDALLVYSSLREIGNH